MCCLHRSLYQSFFILLIIYNSNVVIESINIATTPCLDMCFLGEGCTVDTVNEADRNFSQIKGGGKEWMVDLALHSQKYPPGPLMCSIVLLALAQDTSW